MRSLSKTQNDDIMPSKYRQNVELQQVLSALKWSQAKLSRRIGVDKNTVGRWVSGKNKVPKVVIMYLELKYVLQDLAK